MGTKWDYAVVIQEGDDWVLQSDDGGVGLGETLTAALRAMGADGWELEHVRPERIQRTGNMTATYRERLIFKRPLLVE